MSRFLSSLNWMKTMSLRLAIFSPMKYRLVTALNLKATRQQKAYVVANQVEVKDLIMNFNNQIQ